MQALQYPDFEPIQRLPSVRQRLFAQRLFEVLDPRTHPYYLERIKSNALPLDDLSVDSFDLAAASSTMAAADSLRDVLLSRGGATDWQRSAVRFLINRKNDSMELTFSERLSRLLRTEPELQQATPQISLMWRVAADFPGRRVLPGRQPQLTPNPLLKEGLRVAGLRVNDKPQRALRTRPYLSRGVFDRYALAAQLRTEGSVLVDMLRIANPAVEVSVGTRIEVVSERKQTDTWLAIPSVPRLSDGRLDAVMARVLDMYESDPAHPTVRKFLNSFRWLSIFLTRWRESPAFATPILYMAIEALFQKQVRFNPKELEAEGQAVAEMFAKHAENALLRELSQYVQECMNNHIGLRPCPMWCSRIQVPPYQDTPWQDWLRLFHRRLHFALEYEPHAFDDPLLLFRTHALSETDLLQQNAKLASASLTALRQARNHVAHRGEQMAHERRARELAASGIEILCAGYETLAGVHASNDA